MHIFLSGMDVIETKTLDKLHLFTVGDVSNLTLENFNSLQINEMIKLIVSDID
jgi:hypothetical protein